MSKKIQHNIVETGIIYREQIIFETVVKNTRVWLESEEFEINFMFP